MNGFTFLVPIRVRFADTDAQGVAHNSAYVVWFEVARVEYLREFAGGYQALRDQGIEALVLEVVLPLPDPGAVRRRAPGPHALRRASWRAFPLRVRDRPGRRALADGHAPSTPASTRQTFRPTRVPEWLADRDPSRRGR